MKISIDHIDKIFFLGIGGIGMSALARYFLAQGKHVGGYDLTSSSITSELIELGADIHFIDDVRQISDRFKSPVETLVIRTPAVPEDHKELNYFQSKKFQIVKRAEVLGMLFNSRKGIGIAGTHGKTSVSSMAGFILSRSEQRCSAFLGGILKNVNSNLILDEKSPWVVAEADEFDRSFLHLHPYIALITWVDADHLDIYGTEAEIKNAFSDFASQVQEDGTLIIKEGITLKPVSDKIKFLTYSLENREADFYANHIRIEAHRYVFDIHTPTGIIENVRLIAPGLVNVENAVAAAAVAHEAGVQLEIIGESLGEFAGVKRRFDIQLETEECTYIDDYAHHPRELDAVIDSVRKLYPGKQITGIFQPHLYSRTRDFADEFAVSLSKLDNLLLLDVYPAREKAIAGIDSGIIFNSLGDIEKMRCTKYELLPILQKREFEVLLTLGAGDIDRFVEPIKKILEVR